MGMWLSSKRNFSLSEKDALAKTGEGSVSATDAEKGVSEVILSPDSDRSLSPYTRVFFPHVSAFVQTVLLLQNRMCPFL